MLKSLQTREKPTEQLGKASKGYNMQGPLLHTVTLKLTLLPYSFQEVFLKKASFFKALTPVHQIFGYIFEPQSGKV